MHRPAPLQNVMVRAGRRYARLWAAQALAMCVIVYAGPFTYNNRTHGVGPSGCSPGAV